MDTNVKNADMVRRSELAMLTVLLLRNWEIFSGICLKCGYIMLKEKR